MKTVKKQDCVCYNTKVKSETCHVFIFTGKSYIVRICDKRKRDLYFTSALNDLRSREFSTVM